jgi:DNA-binding NarL/FixJ family response regulator
MLVDDHSSLVEALAYRFATEPGFQVAAAATTPEDAMLLIRGRHVDVALLDIDLDGCDGIRLGADLRSRRPGLRLAAMTCSESVDQLTAAVRAGFTGWIPKTVQFADLMKAVRAVYQGEGYMPGDMLGPLLRELVAVDRTRQRHDHLVAALTARERQVLRCMATGLSRDGIAQRLDMSGHTVRTHTQNILTKLDVHSTLAAVAFYRGSQAADPTEGRSDP